MNILLWALSHPLLDCYSIPFFNLRFHGLNVTSGPQIRKPIGWTIQEAISRLMPRLSPKWWMMPVQQCKPAHHKSPKLNSLHTTTSYLSAGSKRLKCTVCRSALHLPKCTAHIEVHCIYILSLMTSMAWVYNIIHFTNDLNLKYNQR